jgi:tape measure domain-containing protein
MPSIDERVVSMAFENAIFEQRVAVTMGTLAKLNTAIATTGQKSGLSNIEADANKVTLQAPMSALDKLKAKFGLGVDTSSIQNIEKSGDKVTLQTPMSALDRLKAKLGRGVDASSIQDIEKAGDKVHLSGPARALDRLQSRFDKGLDANKAFSGIERASGQVNLDGLNNVIEKTAGHFSVLTGAAAVAIGNITAQAAAAAARVVSKSLNTVKEGFSDYELKVGATQNIMAGTGEGIKATTRYLKDLDIYADQTIYSLSDMTSNIGKFTNAGVKLPVAVQAMKGISNEAALSGASTEEAARSMYNLGQAIGSGTVRLMDWRSVELANMGTKEFKEELIKSALAQGSLKKANDGTIRSLKGNEVNYKTFNATLADQWLTSEALTKTLGKYADENTNLGKKAYKAAKDVKTFSMMMTTLSAAAGTGWTDTFDIIIGSLPEATKLFTNITNAVGGFIGKTADMRNKVLKEWKDLGGRTLLIQGLKDAFHALFAILGTVSKAFRDVFPRKTGEDLFNMTKSFANFAKAIQPSKETLENLRRTLAGVFAVAHIGWTIIKDLGKVIFDLIGIAGKGSGGILNFTGGIGDFLVSIDKAISKGNALGGFFKGLTNILRVPIELVKGIGSAIAGLFGGFDGPKAQDIHGELEKFGKVLTPMERLVNNVKSAWKGFSGVLDQFKTIVDPWFSKIGEQFAHIGDVIADGIKNADFDKVLLAFQTTFLGGIFITLKKLVEGGKSFDITGGALGNLSKGLETLTGNLKVMQHQVQATTIFTIAAAVVALAVGVKLLSTIDPKKMATAMTAVAIGLGELGAALRIMATGKIATVTMPIIATGMFILAGAVVVLAAAMKIMATMSWEEIGKGLAGIGGALAVIGVGMKAIGAVRLIPIAAGLLILGAALNVIAVATKIFAGMKWEELAKGLLGLGGALVAMGIGMAFIGPQILLIGPGLVAAAIGMTLLAGAVSAFGSMNLGALAKGIIGAGLAVAALGIATALIPPTIGIQAAGLILLGIGLTALGGAVAIFGSMSVGKLAKGIIAMGAALVVLGVGLTFMAGTLPGSVALLAAASALAILAPTLAFMGVLSWGVILKGLAAMALSLGVIAVVGLVAAPALLALGGALAVLGVGLVLVGTAIYIAAKGLALLGENGAKGIGVLVTAITAFVALLPSLVINFVKGLVSIFEEVAKVAPKVVLALGVILDTVIAFVIEQAPKLAQAVNALIAAILNVLAANAGPMIQAGWRLIQQMLSGISSNIGSVVTKVGEIIAHFLNALSGQMPRIVQAGVRLLGSFLTGVTASLPRIIASAANVIVKFLQGISQQLPKIVAKAGQVVTTYINAVANQIPRIIAAGARLIVKFIDGIGNAIPRIIAAGARVILKFINGIANTVPRLVNAGFKAVIRFLNGIASAIRQNDDQVIDAMANVGDAIGTGLIKGLRRIGPWVKKAVTDLIKALPKKALSILGIHSPSTVFQEIGQYTMLGLAKGIGDNSSDVNQAMADSTTSMVETAKSTLNGSNMLDGIVDAEPVITPILDLSGVEKEANKLPGLTNVTPITAAASYGQASTIARERQAAQLSESIQLRASLSSAPPAVKFEQNNYSPESLSHVEIYRQTNNQLAQAKRSLGVEPWRLFGA